LSSNPDKANSPLVSIVILNHNGLKYLKEGLAECLDSVLMTKYPNFELILVDNGSDDGSVGFIGRKYDSKVKVVKNKRNLGWSEGFNEGIRACKGSFIALLSNDMTVDPNWLNPIIDLMVLEPRIGLAGFKRLQHGRQGVLDGIGGDLYLCGRVKPIGVGEPDCGQYDSIREDIDYIGGAMVLRTMSLKETGLFDPDFFIFCEDIDLCYKTRKCGYKVVYVPQAVIYHRGQATLKGRDPKGTYLEYMAYRSRVRCAILHFTIRRLLSTFLIDTVCLGIANSTTKKLLLKAYWQNLKTIGYTLKKRLSNGPSPPFSCKAPILFFGFADFKKRARYLLDDKIAKTNDLRLSHSPGFDPPK
jgi:GT2 family glycosyltransferase